METLGRGKLFDYGARIASGQRAVSGKKPVIPSPTLAPNGAQTDRLTQLQNSAPKRPAAPVKAGPGSTTAKFKACQTARGLAAGQIGLVVPTSLCRGRRKMMADKLNSASARMDGCRVCGLSSHELRRPAENVREILLRTWRATVPSAGEARAHPGHGCEKPTTMPHSEGH